jgi:outer membrane protein TolC
MARAPALPEALREVPGRTDVRASDRRLRAADRVYRDRWADYLPYLVGSFQPYYQDPPTLMQPTWGYQGLLVLTVPFYDGGFRYGAAEERKALAKEARANLEAVLRQANSDVRLAFETMYRADDALRQARDAAHFAENALELATLAYRAGATTNIEVIDAERSARDAETAASIAEDAARQARLDLLIASGRFP